MLEDEPGGMQERPLKMLDRPDISWHVAMDAAVERVADHRMPDGAEVNANLVCPAGVDRNPGEGDSRVQMFGPNDPRHCFTASARARRHLLPIGGIPANRRVDSSS